MAELNGIRVYVPLYDRWGNSIGQIELEPRVVEQLPERGSRVGELIFNRQDGSLYWWNGSEWKSTGLAPHTHPRSDITDFWDSPFWNNIPDKPSAYPPEAHASSHAKGGSDELKNLTYEQLASDTIVFTTYFPVPDSHVSGLPCDSTGVKWTSDFRGKWDKRHLKKVRIRAAWLATEQDVEIKVAVQDMQTGNDVVAFSGGFKEAGEAETTDLSNVTDGGMFGVYAEVTTASGTTGATFDLAYVVVELVYGVS